MKYIILAAALVFFLASLFLCMVSEDVLDAVQFGVFTIIGCLIFVTLLKLE
jgi:hypothetical protein